ncbi:hypothetical protein OF83DRAFT_89817 [Amylostereum chailletii]|nr:hypothetical protein OF83DRAFT_89817 [Amylostereum chailletii]
MSVGTRLAPSSLHPRPSSALWIPQERFASLPSLCTPVPPPTRASASRGTTASVPGEIVRRSGRDPLADPTRRLFQGDKLLFILNSSPLPYSNHNGFHPHPHMIHLTHPPTVAFSQRPTASPSFVLDRSRLYSVSWTHSLYRSCSSPSL